MKKRKGLETILLSTGQHRQMLDQVLKVFDIVPDYDLSIMKDNQTLFDITSNVLNGCKDIFEKEKFDIVYVYEISPITMVWPALTAKKYWKGLI